MAIAESLQEGNNVYIVASKNKESKLRGDSVRPGLVFLGIGTHLEGHPESRGIDKNITISVQCQMNKS